MRTTLTSTAATRRVLALLLFGTASVGCTATRGRITETDRPLDIAIVGEGFFVVQTPQGGYLFTRKGDLSISSDNRLVNSDGYTLAPSIALPIDVAGVVISPDGRVTVSRIGEPAATALGTLKLAKFANPLRLTRDGEYFVPSDGSGEPTTHRPGSDGVGLLRTQALEK